jgi:hypothetical protein
MHEFLKFADMGGASQCVEARLQLIRRFAAAAAEQMEARLANGHSINIADHALLSSTTLLREYHEAIGASIIKYSGTAKPMVPSVAKRALCRCPMSCPHRCHVSVNAPMASRHFEGRQHRLQRRVLNWDGIVEHHHHAVACVTLKALSEKPVKPRRSQKSAAPLARSNRLDPISSGS